MSPKLIEEENQGTLGNSQRATQTQESVQRISKLEAFTLVQSLKA